MFSFLFVGEISSLSIIFERKIIMKIYKFLFYFTYSALIVSIYFWFESTDDISPLINTLFVAGGLLAIPLILWILDIISIESEKEKSVNDGTNNKENIITMEQTEA